MMIGVICRCILGWLNLFISVLFIVVVFWDGVVRVGIVIMVNSVVVYRWWLIFFLFLIGFFIDFFLLWLFVLVIEL